ncbi:MAG: ZIP family metal transporter [Candidatus Taylorbacteria bacterium]
MILIISIATLIATLVGGFVAIKFKDKLHLILGFSAGAVVAVAFFDLIPEAINLGSHVYSVETIMTFVVVGFLAYLILDRVVFLHAHAHEDDEVPGFGDMTHIHTHHDSHNPEHIESKKMNQGILGAGSLSVHSFIDGIAIGLAFQVSSAVGIIVAVAVLVHDFSDGINTVSMILRHKGHSKSAVSWLVVDALAPVCGVISTMFFTVSEQGLSIILAVFAGFFLYIGASDLIPESHHNHPKLLTTVMTLCGALVLYGAIRIAGL